MAQCEPFPPRNLAFFLIYGFTRRGWREGSGYLAGILGSKGSNGSMITAPQGSSNLVNAANS